MRAVVFLLLLVPAISFSEESPILLGAGTRARPDYDGSASRIADLIPVVRYYRGPWFARTTQGILEGGARLSLGRGLDAGAQLAYEQGPRDDHPGASLGAHLEWDTKAGPVPLTLLGRVRQHLKSERGVQADARATAGAYSRGGIVAGVFAQATFASSKFTQAYYGVREPGLLYTSLGALGSYDFSRHWVGVGSVEVRRLASDLAGSAFVRRRSGWYASAGLAYRF